MPQISIVTPAYNAQRFIRATLESVIAQTALEWEYTVVEDGSTDATSEIVSEVASQEPRIRLIKQDNGRVCRARNNGFANSSPASKYLLFLDHDDVIEPDFLEVLAGYLDARPEVGAVYCQLRLVDGDGKPAEPEDLVAPRRYAPAGLARRTLGDDEPDTNIYALAAHFQAIPSSTLFRRTVYEAAGGWNEETCAHVYEDKDLMMRCSLLAPVHFFARPLVRYRLHETNLSWAPNTGYQKHYERRWLRADFVPEAQRPLARAAIAFDRRVSGLDKLGEARTAFAEGRLGPAIKYTLQGVRKLVTAPLARFGR